MRDNRTTLTEHLIRQVRVVHSDGGGLKGHKSTLIFFFPNVTMLIVNRQQHNMIACLIGKRILVPNSSKTIRFSYFMQLNWQKP